MCGGILLVGWLVGNKNKRWKFFLFALLCFRDNFFLDYYYTHSLTHSLTLTHYKSKEQNCVVVF